MNVNVGALEFSLNLVAQRLALPPGHEIVRCEAMPSEGVLRVWVEGPDMPPCSFPQRVGMLLRSECQENGQHKLTASWHHAPEKSWPIESV